MEALGKIGRIAERLVTRTHEPEPRGFVVHIEMAEIMSQMAPDYGLEIVTLLGKGQKYIDRHGFVGRMGPKSAEIDIVGGNPEEREDLRQAAIAEFERRREENPTES